MLKSFLNFKNGYPNRISITEPVGMDGESFTIETELFAPDLEYGNAEQPLIFWRGVYEEGQTTLTLPSGATIFNMETMGYDWLLEYDKLYGTEAIVERIIEKDGQQFIVGEIDFESMEIFENYISAKVVMNGQRTAMRTEADTKLDMYSAFDLAGNTIAPLVAENILIKAVPLYAESTWRQTEQRLLYYGYHFYFNFARQNNGGIKSSLVPYNEADELFQSYEGMVNNFRYIRAKNDLTDVKMTVTLDYDWFYRFNSGGGYSPTSKVIGTVIIAPEPFTTPSNAIYYNDFYTHTIDDGINQDYHENTTILINLPDVPADYCVHVFWYFIGTDGHLPQTGDIDYLATILAGAGVTGAIFDLTGDPQAGSALNVTDQTFKITASAVGIDSTSKGLRWGDCQRQAALQICGMPMVNPRWDVGGEHYDNFRITGNGMRGRDDKPFLETWKTLLQGTREVAGDAMINQSNVFVGEYPDFYQNIDMGALIELPSNDSKETKDTRYTLKLFNYKYNKYATSDKDPTEFVRNSAQSVHTELQKRFPSRRNKNVLSIDIPHTRDPIAGEEARAQSVVTRPEVSLSTDDDIFMYNVTMLSSGTMGGFGRKLLTRNNGNFTITILNQSSDGDPTFGWTTLGISVGDTIYISGGGNTQNWQVQSLSVTQIVLIALPGTVIDIEGDLYLRIDYYITNTRYVVRTDQGIYSEGIDNPERFGNQAYTPRQNIRKWEPFLHTAGYDCEASGVITTTEFKNNGFAKTWVSPSTRLYVENEPMPIAQLEPAILSYRLINSKFTVDFDTMIAILDRLQIDRGFVRVRSIDGTVVRAHFRTLKYFWFPETLQAELWPRAGQDKVMLVGITGGILINGAFYAYDGSQLPTSLLGVDWFSISNGELRMFDSLRQDLFTPTDFTKVPINGITYLDLNAFTNALLAILPINP